MSGAREFSGLGVKNVHECGRVAALIHLGEEAVVDDVLLPLVTSSCRIPVHDHGDLCVPSPRKWPTQLCRPLRPT